MKIRLSIPQELQEREMRETLGNACLTHEALVVAVFVVLGQNLRREALNFPDYDAITPLHGIDATRGGRRELAPRFGLYMAQFNNPLLSWGVISSC